MRIACCCARARPPGCGSVLPGVMHEHSLASAHAPPPSRRYAVACAPRVRPTQRPPRFHRACSSARRPACSSTTRPCAPDLRAPCTPSRECTRTNACVTAPTTPASRTGAHYSCVLPRTHLRAHHTDAVPLHHCRSPLAPSTRRPASVCGKQRARWRRARVASARKRIYSRRAAHSARGTARTCVFFFRHRTLLPTPLIGQLTALTITR